ncbi:Hypothetical protein PHPALM_12264 [Phytophthora palmivora]|uniref:PiggyBac transposable element-derived protein domain-containing protein n=1 Tax=Phytophthora palmivora TaxID=4796 RepID=A0A2P4Y066_9STRA|nr:Hypothetical protein PHPALM_12264 [Phytophthora palmivora]
MLCPHAKGLSAHWRKSQHGAVPIGTFGRWLSRNRFDHVMQNLHFNSSKSPQARVDRGWKVQSVVATLQKTFARGYKIGHVIAFDEAIIPTRSSQNPTRQYLPQKPHKWGTKFFAACCGDTAYCMRIEMYVGAKSHLAVPPAADNSCGAAAVVRNLDLLLPRSSCSPFRIVVTDRYYTSVVLALELLHRRLYLTGTIQSRRAGFAEDVITKKKVYSTKPSEPVRGTIKLAENKKFPQIIAAMWMDNHPVHMISTGGSRSLGPVYYIG